MDQQGEMVPTASSAPVGAPSKKNYIPAMPEASEADAAIVKAVPTAPLRLGWDIHGH